jgi:hypothetical protein
MPYCNTAVGEKGQGPRASGAVVVAQGSLLEVLRRVEFPDQATRRGFGSSPESVQIPRPVFGPEDRVPRRRIGRISAKSRVRWFQFRLRSLLIALTLLVIVPAATSSKL